MFSDSNSSASFWQRTGFPGLTILGLVMMVVGISAAIFFTPWFEKQQFGGWAHKIMYLHIPFAIVSFVGFFFGFVSALLFLFKRVKKYNDYSRSCIEVGFVFSICVLISGPLWAKPMWGVWWSFEPRLNTFLIMFVVYAVYFLIGPFLNTEEVRDKFRAAWAVMGFFTVPMVYLSIYMIDPRLQNHPRNPELMPAMTWTIRLMMATLFLLFLSLSRVRYILVRAERTLTTHARYSE